MTAAVVALTGLATGLGLIVAIGAQNAFVLRQGIRRDGIAGVVAVCAISDAVLIAAGTAGIGEVIARAPWLIDGMRWAGAAYLLWFAFTAARSALHPSTIDTGEFAGAQPEAEGRTRTRVVSAPVVTALALTWLNPHVYLDTVILVGTVANQYGPQRWVFAAGAIAASLLWFVALGFGARALAPYLKTARAWRIIDAVIAVIMVAVALRLVL